MISACINPALDTQGRWNLAALHRAYNSAYRTTERKSGETLTFENTRDTAFVSLEISGNSTQAGGGDAAPDNVRSFEDAEGDVSDGHQTATMPPSIYGVTYTASAGKVGKRCLYKTLVLDGSDDEPWHYSGVTKRHYVDIADATKAPFAPENATPQNTVMWDGFCDTYKTDDMRSINDTSRTNSACWVNAVGRGVAFRDTRFASVAAFRAHLQSNPITVHYKLANATVEDITNTELGQAILKLRCHDGTTTITQAAAVKFGLSATAKVY